MAEKTVKVIQPTVGIINQTRIQKAAAYCRVSTDSEDQANSFSAQLKYYSDYIRNNPDLEFVDIYADEGITGTSVNKREDFKRMIHDASVGKIDRIFVKSVSRFARNSLECLEAIRKLSSYGVTVLFENDHIDTKTMNSELILYVKSAFAQSEAMACSKRMKTAIRMKMKTGNFRPGSIPLGYMYDENNNLVINPEQKEIVEKMFDLHLNGYGYEKITEYLNKNGIKSNCGKWSVNGVSYVLNNEKSMGDSLLQKNYKTEIFPFKLKKNNGVIDKYYIEDSHIGIIKKEDFEISKNIKYIKGYTDGKKEIGNYIFTNYIKCSNCGNSYKRVIMNGKYYWQCGNKSSAGKTCNGKTVSEEYLKKMFVLFYNKLKRFENVIIDKTVNDVLSVRNKDVILNDEIMQIDMQIVDLCDKNNMYEQLHNKKIIDDTSYYERTSEFKYKLSDLRAKRMKIISDTDDSEIFSELKGIKDILSESPNVIIDFDENLMRSLINKISIDDDKGVIFFVKGVLKLKITDE